MKNSTATLSRKLDKELALFLKQTQFKQFHLAQLNTYSFDEFLNNKLLIISAIRAGIPYSIFDLIQSQSPFSEKDWANFLDISSKSLLRYKMSVKFHFKPIHSEKIIELAEVTRAGLDVFGNLEKFKLWLNTPNFALGSVPPIELLKDSYGKEMVLAELTRINHGILA